MGRCSSKSARRSRRDGCNRLRGLSVCFTAFSRASGDETPVSGGGLPRHEGCSTPLSDEAASFTLLRPLIRSGSAKRGRERRERPLAFAGAVTGSNVIWSGYSICILYTLNSLGPHSFAVANLPPATVAHVMQVGLPLLSILYCPRHRSVLYSRSPTTMAAFNTQRRWPATKPPADKGVVLHGRHNTLVLLLCPRFDTF